MSTLVWDLTVPMIPPSLVLWYAMEDVTRETGTIKMGREYPKTPRTTGSELGNFGREISLLELSGHRRNQRLTQSTRFHLRFKIFL